MRLILVMLGLALTLGGSMALVSYQIRGLRADRAVAAEPVALALSPAEQDLIRAACARAMQEEMGAIFKYRTPLQEGRDLGYEANSARIMRGVELSVTGYRRCLRMVTEQAAKGGG